MSGLSSEFHGLHFSQGLKALHFCWLHVKPLPQMGTMHPTLASFWPSFTWRPTVLMGFKSAKFGCYRRRAKLFFRCGIPSAFATTQIYCTFRTENQKHDVQMQVVLQCLNSVWMCFWTCPLLDPSGEANGFYISCLKRVSGTTIALFHAISPTVSLNFVMILGLVMCF